MSLLQLFPIEKREFWRQVCSREASLQEIRLRVDKPIIVISGGREMFLNRKGELVEYDSQVCSIEAKELEALLEHICHYSLYAYEDELKQGFITVSGGHRVGIAGQVVMEGADSIRTIKHISCMNIRIAHQMRGVADKVLPQLYQNGRFKNTLIISPPGCGKTTLLRDIIRQVSDGNAYAKGISVGVVDERSEIAGSYLGKPQNDVGMRTDVLDACPKALGMMLLLRSMSPGVIAVDELGSEEDMDALRRAAACGSRILATVHGEGIEDFLLKFREEQLFECFVILGRQEGHPRVCKICGREEAYASYTGSRYDIGRLPGTGAVVSGAVPGQASHAS